jgi:hypothetical protein
MRSSLRCLLLISLVAMLAAPAAAQVYSSPSTCQSCGTVQAYRLSYQTVYDQQQVTAYKTIYETAYEDRQVTTYKPVWETQYRDASYNRVSYMPETAEREEQYTVARQIVETQERTEVSTVLKPVCETSYRTEYRTVMQPVTTCQTQYVDQGQYVEQTVLKPGLPQTKLAWQPAASVTDPVTGAVTYQRAGLYWVQSPAGRYEVQRVWQPNVVAQQVQQTNYVPQTVAEQVPVQVTRYVPEQVTKVVPYQVCRVVQEPQVRKVQYTTYKQVVERVEQQVPERVCKMVAVQETVRTPRCVEKQVPVTYSVAVPRVVCTRIPIDACGNPVQTCCSSADAYTSASCAASDCVSISTTVPSAQPQSSEPTPANPNKKPGAATEAPRTFGPQSSESEWRGAAERP